MSGDSTAVLDLLFDQCDGVLKEEAPAIQSLDFVSEALRLSEYLISHIYVCNNSHSSMYYIGRQVTD